MSPTGLEKIGEWRSETRDAHTLSSIWDARLPFPNWYSTTRAMETAETGKHSFCHCSSVIPLRLLCFFPRGSKGFTVSVSTKTANGPWARIASGTFEDPRRDGAQVYKTYSLENLMFSDPRWTYYVGARYVKYTCESYYGKGCALQYIGVDPATHI